MDLAQGRIAKAKKIFQSRKMVKYRWNPLE